MEQSVPEEYVVTFNENNESAVYGNHNEETIPQSVINWDDFDIETEEPTVSHIHEEDQKIGILLDHQENIPMQTGFEDHKTDFQIYPNNEAIPHPNNETIPCPNNEVMNPGTQLSKRRKRKSLVWEHFTIQTVSAGCRRAYCNQCKRSYAYSQGTKVSGTSHLRRHVEKGACSVLLRSQGSSSNAASDPPKRRYKRASKTPQTPFDQDRCRNDICRMIIMHDYPLHMVEHPGFVAFVRNLQPQFDSSMMSFETVQADCLATYQMKKQRLSDFIQNIPGRVSLSLDMRTTPQGVAYVFVTGHFVDAHWNLHRRILNVVMEPYPDSDTALNHAVAVCLQDWSLEGKLFSITYHDQKFNTSEASCTLLRPLLPDNGELIGSCIARTLSSTAKELFQSAYDIVKKIREIVKYVKISEPAEEKFTEMKKQLLFPSESNIFLDDQTQWNTTYQMLVAASELNQVFSCIFAEFEQTPSMEDWKQVKILCTYLKVIFDTANILTSTTNPTANLFYDVWISQPDQALAVTNEDPFITSLGRILREKIDVYWINCSQALAPAVVVDPRYKMKYVEFTFKRLYSEEEALVYIKNVNDRIHKMFEEYISTAEPLPQIPSHVAAFYNSMKKENLQSELDQYLKEPVLARVHQFDVLGWWRDNEMTYPTLSTMARDILSISVSTVPSGCVFDTNAKDMDQYRSSLKPNTVEALVCAKDWMQ